MLRHHKAILRLGLPIAVGQLGVIIMGFADTMMVGRYSTGALAASSFVNSVFNLVAFLLMGYSYGLTPLVGSLFGRGCKSQAGTTLGSAVVCNLLFALLLMAVMGWGYTQLHHMGQPAEIMPLVRPYYLAVLASVPFLALFNALRQFTDGITETRTAMWALLTGNGLNILGNWLLIYGIGPFPELGLLGAGLSTLCSRVVMAVVLLAVILTFTLCACKQTAPAAPAAIVDAGEVIANAVSTFLASDTFINTGAVAQQVTRAAHYHVKDLARAPMDGYLVYLKTDQDAVQLYLDSATLTTYDSITTNAADGIDLSI